MRESHLQLFEVSPFVLQLQAKFRDLFLKRFEFRVPLIGLILCHRFKSRFFLGDLLLNAGFLFCRNNEGRCSFVRFLTQKIHPAEVRCKMVVVILSVSFERMIVALGAADSSPQKRLSDRSHDLRVFDLTILTDRNDVIADLRLGDRISGGGYDIASDLIPRAIGLDLLANPSLHRADALTASDIVITFFAILQQVAQDQSPIVRKLRAFQQFIDQACSLTRILVVQKGLYLCRCRQSTDRIEEDAAKKHSIVCRGGRRYSKSRQFVKDVLVNETTPFRKQLCVNRLFEGAGNSSDGDLTLKMNSGD